MEWTGEATTERGVRERPFALRCAGRRAVREHQLVIVAIDGPGHGERLPAGQAVDFDAAWRRPEVPAAEMRDFPGFLAEKRWL